MKEWLFIGKRQDGTREISARWPVIAVFLLVITVAMATELFAASSDGDVQLKKEEIRQLTRIADALEKLVGTRR